MSGHKNAALLSLKPSSGPQFFNVIQTETKSLKSLLPLRHAGTAERCTQCPTRSYPDSEWDFPDVTPLQELGDLHYLHPGKRLDKTPRNVWVWCRLMTRWGLRRVHGSGVALFQIGILPHRLAMCTAHRGVKSQHFSAAGKENKDTLELETAD